jgi:hypothetical protein
MPDANTAVLKKLSELDARCVEINQQICEPEIAQDVNKLIPLTKEQGKLMPLVSRYRDYIKITSELEDARSMLNDPEMKEMAAVEIESLSEQQEQLLEDIKNTLVMADDAAIDSVIMEIRPGTGGDEASLFAGNLYDMYKRYAEKQGWKIETMDFSGTEMGGIREVTLNMATASSASRKPNHRGGFIPPQPQSRYCLSRKKSMLRSTRTMCWSMSVVRADPAARMSIRLPAPLNWNMFQQGSRSACEMKKANTRTGLRHGAFFAAGFLNITNNKFAPSGILPENP